MKATRGLYLGLMAVGLTVILAACATQLDSQQSADTAIRIGQNDLGGVVTGASGPEAGVWVIAETTDLPTKFAKIVVTDDRGRYVMPELPKANYSVWVRGYGLVDSPKVRTAPGKTAQPHGGAGAERGRGGAILSGDLLVFDAQDPGEERVPRRGKVPAPGRVAERREDRRLQRPVTRWALRERARCPRSSPISRPRPTRGRGASSRGRRMPQMARDISRLDAPARAQPVRRLDRPHRRRRAAVREAGAAAGDRAQRRPHAVGLEHAHGLPARSDRRPTGASPRSTPTASSTASPEDSTDFVPVLDPRTHTATRGEAPGARPEDAVARRRARCALAVLGAEADLGRPDQQSQPDDGREGAALVRRARASTRTTRTSARRDRTIRRRRCSRSKAPAAISRCTTRRRASSR